MCSRENMFQLVKMQTHILKVQIHCDGCARKVKKLLNKIEGVYLVSIDTEKQKVKVSGTVDCAKLIRKLIKSGKHAELWSPADHQNQNLQGLPRWFLDDSTHQGQTNGLNAFKTQPVMASDVDRRREQSTGMNSLTGEDNTQLGWGEDIAPNALHMAGNIRSLAFPDSGSSAGDYTCGFQGKGYPHLLSSPGYEHYYAPPYNIMMNPQDLPISTATYEHYNPPMVISSNSNMHPYYQYQASSAANDHFNPPLMMRNNMQQQYQYKYNLPSPLKINNNLPFPGMHTGYKPRLFGDNNCGYPPLGIMNPLVSPAVNNAWNCY